MSSQNLLLALWVVQPVIQAAIATILYRRRLHKEFPAFFAYVARARLHLGHWPYYTHPDPKQLGWWFPHSLLQLGFVGFPVVALASMVLAAVGRARSREFPIWTIIATVVMASAALIAFARIDPGGFMEWFWD